MTDRCQQIVNVSPSRTFSDMSAWVARPCKRNAKYIVTFNLYWPQRKVCSQHAEMHKKLPQDRSVEKLTSLSKTMTEPTIAEIRKEHDAARRIRAKYPSTSIFHVADYHREILLDRLEAVEVVLETKSFTAEYMEQETVVLVGDIRNALEDLNND